VVNRTAIVDHRRKPVTMVSKHSNGGSCRWENDGSVTTADDDGPYGRYGVVDEDDSQQLLQNRSNDNDDKSQSMRNSSNDTDSSSLLQKQPVKSTRRSIFQKVSQVGRSKLLSRMSSRKRLSSLEEEEVLIEGDVQAQQAADALAYQLEYMGYDLECESFLTRDSDDKSHDGVGRKERYAMPGGSSIGSGSSARSRYSGRAKEHNAEERDDLLLESNNARCRSSKEANALRLQADNEKREAENESEEESSSSDESDDSDDEDSDDDSSDDSSDDDGDSKDETIPKEGKAKSVGTTNNGSGTTKNGDTRERSSKPGRAPAPEQDATTIAETMAETNTDDETPSEHDASAEKIIVTTDNDASAPAKSITKMNGEGDTERTPHSIQANAEQAASGTNTKQKKQEKTDSASAKETAFTEENSSVDDKASDKDNLAVATAAAATMSVDATNARFPAASSSWQPNFQQFTATTTAQEEEVSVPATKAVGGENDGPSEATPASTTESDRSLASTVVPSSPGDNEEKVELVRPLSPLQKNMPENEKAAKMKKRWGSLWSGKKSKKNRVPGNTNAVALALPEPIEEHASEDEGKSLMEVKKQNLLPVNLRVTPNDEEASDDEETSLIEDKKGTPNSRGRLSFGKRFSKGNRESSAPSSLLEVVAVTGDEVELVLPQASKELDESENDLPQRTRSPFRRRGKSPPSFSSRRSNFASFEERSTGPMDDDDVPSASSHASEAPEVDNGFGSFFSGLSTRKTPMDSRKPLSLPERKKLHDNKNSSSTADAEAMMGMDSECKNPLQTSSKTPRRRSKIPDRAFADEMETVGTEEMDGSGCRNPCDPCNITNVYAYFDTQQNLDSTRLADDEEEYSEDETLDSYYESRLAKLKTGRQSFSSRGANKGKSPRSSVGKSKKASTKRNSQRKTIGDGKKKQADIQETRRGKQLPRLSEPEPEPAPAPEKPVTSSKRGFFAKRKQRQLTRGKEGKKKDRSAARPTTSSKSLATRFSKSSSERNGNAVDLSQLENITLPSEWAELNDAAHVIEHMMSNVGDHSNATMDDAELLLNTRKSTLGEVENALATLRKHANKLGVRESDLLLATTKTFDSNGGS